MTQKIVINACYGGFSLSKKGLEFMAAAGSPEAQKELDTPAPRRIMDSYYPDIERNNPTLVATIEALGPMAAGGELANLKVVEIPDGVAWEIQEYDGNEWVAEKHDTWS